MKIRPFGLLFCADLPQGLLVQLRRRNLICRCLRHRCRAIAGLALVMLVMGLVRVRIFELRLVMEVQGASRTLRDAVGYRSRRFLRRQRAISQVFFWDLYDGGEDRLDLLASNPFLEPCLQLYAYFLLWRSWNPAVINCLLTKMRGLEAHSVETELRTCLKTRASRERAATQHPIPSRVSR